MRLYSTVNDIVSEMQALVRNVTGRATMTALESDIVQNAIVDAYQVVLLEYGVDTFKFQEQSITVDTVAGTGYVELPDYCYKVVGGTVRIPASDVLLGLLDEKTIYQTDPGAEQTGQPEFYAYMNGSTVNKLRLGLYPIPDAEYTLAMNVLQYPEDNLTSFPASLNSAIKHKAKGLACLGLGMGAVKSGFDAAYEDIIAKIKDGYNNDQPRHVGMRLTFQQAYNGEGRIG